MPSDEHSSQDALFDNFEDFGDWPILLSTRARKDLQEAKKCDGTTFQIAMKKIEWDSALHHNDYD